MSIQRVNAEDLARLVEGYELRAMLREAADLLERWVAAMENPARWASPYSESVVLLPRLRAVLPQDEPTP